MNQEPLRELSLFSGAGGGLLGTKLLGWRHCGYVEYNDYCQRTIRQRIEDGILDEAPIFGDIRTFISEGYADAYQGMVDVVTAGFPCQPFSSSGKNKGEADDRNMWPETIETIRRIRPRFVFLENVTNLLNHEYARQIFRDLAKSGFNIRWDSLGTYNVGGDCRRERVWIMASREKIGWQSNIEQLQLLQKKVKNSAGFTRDSGTFYAAECGRYLRETKPGMDRVIDSVAARMDRIEATGNGQDPVLAATAWRLLA